MHPTVPSCEDGQVRSRATIQPHGALVVCDLVSFQVMHISANACDFFGLEPSACLGHPIDVLFHATERDSVIAMVAFAGADEPGFRLANSQHGAVLDCVVHRVGHVVLVEVEKLHVREHAGFEPKAHSCLVRLARARNPLVLPERSVRELRILTGFDRVMLYRFDADSNGKIVAEVKRPDLKPFAGLHVPASVLEGHTQYNHSTPRVQVVGDITFEGVEMQPAPGSSMPLDLSQAHLRTASSAHLAHLDSLGVTASMSIPLLLDDRLIGLLVCHHHSGPRVVPHVVRETVECAAKLLVWNWEHLERKARAQHAHDVAQHEREIEDSLAGDDCLLDRLATISLCSLTRAAGAAIVLAEGTRTVGIVPGSAVVSEIVEWLSTRDSTVFATDHLARHLPMAHAWTNAAAGLIAVTLSRELGEYLMWFRPCTERVVDWLAKPEPNEATLALVAPEGAQPVWRETVRDRCVEWEEWQLAAAVQVRGLAVAASRRELAKLRYLNQRFADADRSKDMILATISHEIRNPLAAIAGWSRLYLDGGLPAERRDDAVRVVARNAGVLTNLVDDLLDVSRMLAGNLSLKAESVDLAVLIQSVVTSMSVATDAKGVRVQVDLDRALCPILGDSVRLRQVVSNLVSNAVKFTPKGGHIYIALSSLGSDIELQVRDTGIGLDSDSITHVFETFWQVDSSTMRKEKGIGLGLSIVKHLVELHGGSVSADSPGLGQGTTFRVLLPIASTKFAASQPPPRQPPFALSDKPRLDNLRLLLVEDQEDSRSLVRNILERMGAIVVDVSNAQDALDVLANEHFDALISDVGMPDMDGLQLITAVRNNAVASIARLPAVALTAYTRAADRSRVLWSGFQAHVAKPIDANELLAVVRSVVERE